MTDICLLIVLGFVSVRSSLYVVMAEPAAKILVLDLPSGCVFGIDKSVWFVGTHFRGVKGIPAGIHFVFYASVDREGTPSVRKGFFQYLHTGVVYPLIWDSKNEDMRNDLSYDETERLKFNWKESERFCILYPQENSHAWHRLTHFVSHSNFLKISHHQERVFIGPEYKILSSNLDKESELEKALLQQLSTRGIEEKSIIMEFTIIPRLLYPSNCNNTEISKHCMDRSYTLEQIIDQCGNHVDDTISGIKIISEMQLSFLCFVIGGGIDLLLTANFYLAYEGFQQWKAILYLFSHCDNAIKANQDLFGAFVETLRFQIDEFTQDICDDVSNHHNFLRVCMKRLYSTVRSIQGLQPKLIKRFTLLHQVLQDKLFINVGPSFSSKSYVQTKQHVIEDDEEDDEYKPVIVNEDQCMY